MGSVWKQVSLGKLMEIFLRKSSFSAKAEAVPVVSEPLSNQKDHLKGWVRQLICIIATGL